MYELDESAWAAATERSDRTAPRRDSGALPPVPRAPGEGRAGRAVGSIVARLGRTGVHHLTSTIVRVQELPGRLADVAAMHRRLLSLRSRIEMRIALLERDMRTARDAGRDFCAARAKIEAESLREEALQNEALLEELERVSCSLERERRMLAERLGECTSVADGLPSEGERTRARLLIDEALAKLGVHVGRPVRS